MSWIYNDTQQNVTYMDPDNPVDIDYYIPSTEWELLLADSERRPRWNGF